MLTTFYRKQIWKKQMNTKISNGDLKEPIRSANYSMLIMKKLEKLQLKGILIKNIYLYEFDFSTELLDILMSILKNEETLNPLLASFFSKIFGGLLKHHPEQTWNYLKNKEDLMDDIIKHMQASWSNNI